MTTPMNANYMTLADAVKRRDPNGSQAKVVEMLNQTNDILSDMLWRASNEQHGHRTTLRTSLPTAYFKLLNQGTLTSKSTTAQITESIGKLELWNEVDCDLADQEKDKEAFLLSEARPALEALNEKMAKYLFYGNRATEPEAFTGLFPRYNALTVGNQKQNILDAGGVGNANTSIGLAVWGEETLMGIYPMNGIGGLQVDDKGKVTSETAGGTAAGKRLDVYRTKYSWECGLALRDWRGFCRIANIDSTNLISFSSQANLTELMVKAWHRIQPVAKLGKPVWYMNRTVAEMLDLQRMRILNGAGTVAGGSNLGGSINVSEVDGQMRYSFRGYQIRIVDQLLNTEATVS